MKMAPIVNNLLASGAVTKAIETAVNSTPASKTESDTRNYYRRLTAADIEEENKKKMGMKKGGKVSSASKRADGIATKGKTRGKMV